MYYRNEGGRWWLRNKRGDDDADVQTRTGIGPRGGASRRVCHVMHEVIVAQSGSRVSALRKGLSWDFRTAIMLSTQNTKNIRPNAHPESELKKGEHSMIPHPPPEDYHAHGFSHEDIKPTPDTGWRGQPDVPSQEGGDYEADFLNKPPYDWRSEGDLFKAKYTSYVVLLFVPA